MSNPKSATATKARAEKSPDRLQIECDVAREIISQYLAISAKEAAAEKRKDSPDPEGIRVIEAEHNRIFLEEIEAQLLTPISPVAAPKAVFIAGQTGAGKSNLLKMEAAIRSKSTTGPANFFSRLDLLLNQLR